MARKKRPTREPIEEFYIAMGRDIACSGDLQNIKDTCAFHPDGDAALAETAVEANEEGYPQVVYRVQKFVEIK